MENNEIMNMDEIEVMDEHIVADDGSSFSTGVAMLIGAGLAFAVGGAVKAGKWAYGKIKAKRESRKPDQKPTDEIVESEDVES